MTIKEIQTAIQTGSGEEIKSAIRELEKINFSKNRKEIETLLLSQIKNYPAVSNSRNQRAIITSLSRPMTYFSLKRYELCRDFLLKALENLNGNIRNQAYYAAEWFLMDLVFSEFANKSLEVEKKKEENLIDFLLSLNCLSKKHQAESQGKVYINDLKSSPFKVIQRLINRILFIDEVGRLLRKSGYEVYPDENDLFGHGYSPLFDEVDNYDLELHEVTFVKEIRKARQVLPTPSREQYGQILRLEVSLVDDPEVKRQIEVSDSLSLYALAKATVYSYDFDFDHPFGFYNNSDVFHSSEIYELFTDLPGVEKTPRAKSVKKTVVKGVWQKLGKQMFFLFDYGDNWLFKIKLLEVKSTDAKSPKSKVVSKVGKSPQQYPQVY